MKKCRKTAALVLAVGMLAFASTEARAAQTLSVKIGTTLDVGVKGGTYKSSDSSIAYVNSEGRVTGKKKGTATISIKKAGKTTKKTVTVKANAKKPAIKVCADEIVISKAAVKELSVEPLKSKEIETPESGEEAPVETPAETPQPAKYHYKVTVGVKNNSSHPAKKVVLKGVVGGKVVELNFGSIPAGKTDTISKEVTLLKETDSFEPLKFYVYTGRMLNTYNCETENLSFTYAVPDTVAPVIKGFVGKNSYNDGIPYQTVYAGEKYDYFKYVTAEDDRDTKVNLTVDTSKVNFKKKGTYTITYIAKDAAGNTAKETAKIAVRKVEQVDEMADSVLREITQKNWSDEKKAVAIHNYTRRHIVYNGVEGSPSWEKEAQNGFWTGRGNCYTFYSVARILLTRAGIPNIEVTRVKGVGEHTWNMAYVDGGWYHIDCNPRKTGGRFCLLTDAQLKDYSSRYGHNSHIWAYDKKPKSGTKVKYPVF